MAKSFDEWIKEEDMEEFKHKAALRLGWEARQEEIDELKDIISKAGNVSMKNLEKFEQSRREYVQLDEKLKEKQVLIDRADLIKAKNDELEEENKKLDNVVAKLAGDIAQLTVVDKNLASN